MISTPKDHLHRIIMKIAYETQTAIPFRMQSIISNINKFFESRVRLGIMSVLTVQDKADFNYLKEMLNLTDGNLASHLRTLENKSYISVNKKFVVGV